QRLALNKPGIPEPLTRLNMDHRTPHVEGARPARPSPPGLVRARPARAATPIGRGDLGPQTLLRRGDMPRRGPVHQEAGSVPQTSPNTAVTDQRPLNRFSSLDN